MRSRPSRHAHNHAWKQKKAGGKGRIGARESARERGKCSSQNNKKTPPTFEHDLDCFLPFKSQSTMANNSMILAVFMIFLPFIFARLSSLPKTWLFFTSLSWLNECTLREKLFFTPPSKPNTRTKRHTLCVWCIDLPLSKPFSDFCSRSNELEAGKQLHISFFHSFSLSFLFAFIRGTNPPRYGPFPILVCLLRPHHLLHGAWFPRVRLRPEDEPREAIPRPILKKREKGTKLV